MDERRKGFRYNISFPVECKRLGLADYFYTTTKDLSLGGAKIISDNFFPKNEVFKVSLNLVKQVFNFNAKVSWCNKERYCDRYSAGFNFFNVSDFDKKQYASFLETINA